MPLILLHTHGQSHAGEVPVNTNLVVQAGIRRFPFPHLRYGCGMGKCAKCACRVLQGAQDLPAPNWKERRQLGPHLEKGYRLMCQLWVQADLELAQDTQPLQPCAPLAAGDASAEPTQPNRDQPCT